MKLRNKKTGEIGYLLVGRGSDDYIVCNDEWDDCGKYKSLAELNKEWEDYEEPETYYYISDCVNITSLTNDHGYNLPEEIWEKGIKRRKEVGNYFETKEEAEKAVEKLKALTRLKNKRFRFDATPYCDNLCGNGFEIHFSATMPPEFWADDEVKNDLGLLFSQEGGE